MRFLVCDPESPTEVLGLGEFFGEFTGEPRGLWKGLVVGDRTPEIFSTDVLNLSLEEKGPGSITSSGVVDWLDIFCWLIEGKGCRPAVKEPQQNTNLQPEMKTQQKFVPEHNIIE